MERLFIVLLCTGRLQTSMHSLHAVPSIELAKAVLVEYSAVLGRLCVGSIG